MAFYIEKKNTLVLHESSHTLNSQQEVTGLSLLEKAPTHTHNPTANRGSVHSRSNAFHMSNHHFIFRVHSLCLQMFPHTKITLKPNFDPVLEMGKKIKKIAHTVMWVRFRQINGYITISFEFFQHSQQTDTHPHRDTPLTHRHAKFCREVK